MHDNQRTEDEKIITLTINPCLDVSADVDVVKPTGKMRCYNDRMDPGGGGINVSRAINILGGRSTAIFPAGGSTGQKIVEMLRTEGIDCLPVISDQLNRQNFAVRERKSGEQYRFSLPGPELPEQIRQDCLQKIMHLQPPPDFVVASGSLPPGVPEDFYGKLARYFRNSPTKVILDTSGEPLRLGLAQQVYLIKPNQRELEYVCDCALDDEAVQEKKCRDIVNKGHCEVLILTLGKNGALLTTKNQQLRIPGIQVKEVSAIGAGDSFMGGMVLALYRGKELADAFLYAMAAGTSALTTEATALCEKEATETYFRQLQQKHRDQRA